LDGITEMVHPSKRLKCTSTIKRVTVIVCRGTLGSSKLEAEVSVIRSVLCDGPTIAFNVLECEVADLGRCVRMVVEGTRAAPSNSDDHWDPEQQHVVWLHLAGHGSKSHFAGSSIRESNERVAIVATDYSPPKAQLNRGWYIELVFANCCHSAALAHAIRLAGVPFAVGWQSACANLGATLFAAALYRGLAQAKSPQTAFTSAKGTLLRPRTPGITIGLASNEHRGGTSTGDQVVANVSDGTDVEAELSASSSDASFAKSEHSLDMISDVASAFEDVLAPGYAFVDPDDADTVDTTTGRVVIRDTDFAFVHCRTETAENEIADFIGDILDDDDDAGDDVAITSSSLREPPTSSRSLSPTSIVCGRGLGCERRICCGDDSSCDERKDESCDSSKTADIMLRAKRRRMALTGEDPHIRITTSLDIVSRRGDPAAATPLFAGPVALGVPLLLCEDILASTSAKVVLPLCPPIALGPTTLPSLGKTKVARLRDLGVCTVQDLAKVDPEDRIFAVAATRNRRSDHAVKTVRKWRDKAITHLVAHQDLP